PVLRGAGAPFLPRIHAACADKANSVVRMAASPSALRPVAVSAKPRPSSRDFHPRPGSLHKPEDPRRTTTPGAGMRGSTEPGGLVLIVEDNRNISEMVGEYLERDRKSTRLNSSHVKISYAVFCL